MLRLVRSEELRLVGSKELRLVRSKELRLVASEMFRLVAIGLVLQTSLGCATGGLINAGRRTERAVRFEAVWTDGSALYGVYRAELRNARGKLVDTLDRAVRVRIADLDPAQNIAVDALPLERMRPGEVPKEGLVAVALLRAAPRAKTESAHVLVVSRENRDVGFLADGLPGAAPEAHLDAAALNQREVAGWIVPLVPLALAWDAVAVPVLAVFAVPYFSASK